MDRLSALEAFVRTVELKSFSRVAAEMRVKQSTVSKWIAALEARFDTRLIERTSRSQHVTPAGDRLYTKAKEILAAYAEAESELAEKTTDLQGRLRISVPVVFGQRFVTPILPELAMRHPRLELDVWYDDRYVRLVEEGFDVAVRVGIPEDSSLKCRTLGRTPRRLVASPAYIDELGAPETPSQLTAHRCLVHSGLQKHTVWTFESTGEGDKRATKRRAKITGRFSANNSEALLAMAKAGQGVALLASWLVDDEIKRGALVPLLGNYRAPDAPIQALMPPTSLIHPRTRMFVDHLAEYLETIVNAP